jgi:hypothetical protein
LTFFYLTRHGRDFTLGSISQAQYVSRSLFLNAG